MFTDPVERTWWTGLQRWFACGSVTKNSMPGENASAVKQTFTARTQLCILIYFLMPRQFSVPEQKVCSVKYFCLPGCWFPHHTSGIRHRTPPPPPLIYLSYFIIKLLLSPNWKHNSWWVFSLHFYLWGSFYKNNIREERACWAWNREKSRKKGITDDWSVKSLPFSFTAIRCFWTTAHTIVWGNSHQFIPRLYFHCNSRSLTSASAYSTTGERPFVFLYLLEDVIVGQAVIKTVSNIFSL